MQSPPTPATPTGKCNSYNANPAIGLTRRRNSPRRALPYRNRRIPLPRKAFHPRLHFSPSFDLSYRARASKRPPGRLHFHERALGQVPPTRAWVGAGSVDRDAKRELRGLLGSGGRNRRGGHPPQMRSSLPETASSTDLARGSVWAVLWDRRDDAAGQPGGRSSAGPPDRGCRPQRAGPHDRSADGSCSCGDILR